MKSNNQSEGNRTTEPSVGLNSNRPIGYQLMMISGFEAETKAREPNMMRKQMKKYTEIFTGAFR